jgi:aspartyl-tRNA(Asn)/glutamyl-tRNA(Gln) amidotransferase subunit C
MLFALLGLLGFTLKKGIPYVTISKICFPGESGMKITKQEVDHVALLARLKFSETEKERFTTQLNTILEYMDKLKELDTTQVEPTFHALARTNVFREDRVRSSNPQDLSLSNAPDPDRGFFRVPKIIE